jgi:hypothetical protein
MDPLTMSAKSSARTWRIAGRESPVAHATGTGMAIE